MRYIYPLDNTPEEVRDRIGGKALSLVRMIEDTHVRIPGGYVVIKDALDEGNTQEAEAELTELIRSLDHDRLYAVRSSAPGEDGGTASYAGQYETETRVRADDIRDAVRRVAASAGSSRVRGYADSFSRADSGMAVVIQEFVEPEFAGVLFTSDIITGRDDIFLGNYVRGEGEKLVSGAENAKTFTIDQFRNRYEGDREFAPCAKTLGKYCREIRKYYGIPMDIEWAVSGKKVFILQARPITTLQRLDMSTYKVNGSMSGYKLLTRTNVGEIFMQPVTPMTFSVLEKINDMLGISDWLDNICGQPYMNISVMCSVMVSFGKSREKAFENIKDLVGNVPDGLVVPISPFDKKAFMRKVFRLLFPKEKSKLSRRQKHEMVIRLPEISRKMIGEIRAIDSNEGLARYWDEVMIPSLNDGLASIMTECGTSLVPLFGTRKKIGKIAGEDMANRLCGGCVGIIECMKPVLLLDDVIEGRMTREDYILTCGHRSVNEMELASPRPYEDPAFIDRLIEEHRSGSADLYAMRDRQESAYKEALAEFKEKYPGKSRWIDKEIAKFVHANDFREDIRSKGVLIFSVFREFLLRAGAVNSLGDDIFYLTYTEALALVHHKDDAVRFIPARKETMEKYNAYPPFPNLILGQFDPDSWMADENRRGDFYCSSETSEKHTSAADIRGFAGASGKVTGTVRVITDVSRIDEVEEGDILVTVATNIGWTLVFPRVSAIVTDIGAPLSHAAIVAREFGIPAVVGCGNATTVLKTGDRVEVDGAAGTVRRLI